MENSVEKVENFAFMQILLLWKALLLQNLTAVSENGIIKSVYLRIFYVENEKNIFMFLREEYIYVFT